MCTTNDLVHPFEAAGLGKAPFRFAGMVYQEMNYGQAVAHTFADGMQILTKPGGTCDACGTYIIDMYRIRSSDGIVSKVGCDCILKLDRADNRLVSEVKRAKLANDKRKRDARRQATREKETTQRLAAFAMLDSREDIRAALTALPHPKFSGSSALAYVEWLRVNAGHSGQMVAAKMIEDAAKA